ncbi:DMT family transporter [Alteribacter natronophilus]|uniref:DMT family transporter n=1 Tax=Alteribacter natronophilus TaxID=2583810 RepID=UPI00110F55D1|nr:DMT family transporter [Alteribacter natronophilus]TMW71256.1 DMT family transporter [Alteribacter natronophilus]
MNKKALMMALITVLIWGSTFAAIRASLQGGYEPGHLILVRYLIASALFLIAALLFRRHFRLPMRKDLPKIAALGFIGISVYHAGVTFGVETISAGTAGMLIGAAPVFTALLAVAFLKEKLSRAGWIGLGIGFTGILVITLGADGPMFTPSPGALFVLIAALATSVFFVFQKPLLRRYHPIELTAYLTWAGTIPLLVFAPGLTSSISQATTEAHLAALFTGIFPAAVAYVTWAVALSIGSAGTVTSTMYLEPAIAIIVAWIWLQELPGLVPTAGGLIAIAGVIAVNRAERAKHETVQQAA